MIRTRCDNMDMGMRIKMLRIEKRMTLEQVAEKIGVSKATVYKYEAGAIANIPPDKIAAMADLFEVSKAYLCGWTNDKADQGGTLLPGIPIPDNDMFVRAYWVMTYEDRLKITEIFDRAYKRLQELDSAQK